MAQGPADCEIRYIDKEVVEAVLCGFADRDSLGSTANIFRALSDPTRVTILHALSMASLCNCDLAAILGISESAVSHQMRELRLLKLVTAERRGRMVYYQISDEHVRHILQDTLRHVQESGTTSVKETGS
jgi:DNA-binding transcriptional ArsR family regulator